MCCYTPNNGSDHVADESAASPTKRRHIDTSPSSIHAALETSDVSSPQTREPMLAWDQVRKTDQRAGSSSMSGVTAQMPPSVSVPDHVREFSFHNFKKLPSRGNANGLSEETNIYTETRMLQDQTGRLRRLFLIIWQFCCVSSDPCFSLHRRCLHPVHSTADPHHCRKHRGFRHGLTLHR